jgi:hypothetical protein
MRDGQDVVASFFKDECVKFIAAASKLADVDACYKTLKDGDTQVDAMTDSDPTLAEMKSRHQQELDLIKKKSTIAALKAF